MPLFKSLATNGMGLKTRLLVQAYQASVLPVLLAGNDVVRIAFVGNPLCMTYFRDIS
jgi:hypothetical protein